MRSCCWHDSIVYDAPDSHTAHTLIHFPELAHFDEQLLLFRTATAFVWVCVCNGYTRRRWPQPSPSTYSSPYPSRIAVADTKSTRSRVRARACTQTFNGEVVDPFVRVKLAYFCNTCRIVFARLWCMLTRTYTRGPYVIHFGMSYTEHRTQTGPNVAACRNRRANQRESWRKFRQACATRGGRFFVLRLTVKAFHGV